MKLPRRARPGPAPPSTASGTTRSAPPRPAGTAPEPARRPAPTLTCERPWPPWPASATCPRSCAAGPPCLRRRPRAPPAPWPRPRRRAAATAAARRRPPGSPYEAIVTAAACRLRLGMPWTLLGGLLGVHRSSLGAPAAAALTAVPVLGLGTPGRTPVRTLRALQHPAAAGITIPLPGSTTPANETAHQQRHARNRQLNNRRAHIATSVTQSWFRRANAKDKCRQSGASHRALR